MRRILIAAAAWAAMTGAAVAGPAEDEIVALERQRSAAILSNDMAFLDDLYLDEFEGMTATGFKVDKATLMEVFKRDDPDTVFTIDQFRVHIFGDTAVDMLRLTGRTPAGAIVSQQQLMHVWVKRGGKWRMRLGQGTLIPEAQRQP